MQSPRFPVQTPMSQPIISSMDSMGLYHSNANVMPPLMPPAQMAYQPMGYAPVPPQTAPYGMPGIGVGQQNYHVGPVGSRGMSIGDMTNNASYSFHPNPPQMETRGGMHRRASRTEKLFNPYPDRPDFGNIPSQPTVRRPHRNSFSSSLTRNQRCSFGAHNRSGYGPYNADLTNYNTVQLGDRQLESAYLMNVPHTHKDYEIDTRITRNHEYGCNDTWIGPKNNSVKHLIVFGVPPEVHREDVRIFIEQHSGVPVKDIRMKEDKSQKPNWHVL